jgi:hypothetical protein
MKNNFIIELNNFPYQRTKLLEIYQQIAHLGRVKGLPWRIVQNQFLDRNLATCLVIQSGDYMMLDPSTSDLDCNLLDFDYIQNLVNTFNIEHTIGPGNLDILIYKPGFTFEPHTDGYCKSLIMFPILPEDGGAPIDFYNDSNITLKTPASYRSKVKNSDIVYTHYYNTNYPTIVNTHKIHGVRRVNETRVYLRCKLNESFESILCKHLQNNLLYDFK